MNGDLVGTSLTLHGAVCAAAVLGIWKLGGESKFGTEKVSDLHNLRPKLLKRIVGSLELCLNPVLTAPLATEAIELDENGNPKPMPAKLSVTGKESLTNAVRDFVKADAQGLLDLREAQALDTCLNRHIDRLRKLVCLIFASSGIVCLLMGAGKFEWIKLDATWIHAVAFGVVAALLIAVAILFWRVLSTSTLVDRLKSQYADLS